MNKNIRKNIVTLSLLAGLFIIPLIAAWILYKNPNLWQRESTNYGTLIGSPLSIEAINFVNETQQNSTQEYLRGYWALLYAGTDCATQCEQQLAQANQLLQALAKEGHRLRAVIATLPQDESTNKIDFTYHTRIHHSTISETGLRLLTHKLATQENSKNDQGLFIIDPIGNLILSYTLPFNNKMIALDLQRLLKASQIG